jgi:hypothetical protein
MREMGKRKAKGYKEGMVKVGKWEKGGKCQNTGQIDKYRNR